MKDQLTKKIEVKIMTWLVSDSENTTLLAEEIAKWHIQKQIELLGEVLQEFYDGDVNKKGFIVHKQEELKSQLK